MSTSRPGTLKVTASVTTVLFVMANDSNGLTGLQRFVAANHNPFPGFQTTGNTDAVAICAPRHDCTRRARRSLLPARAGAHGAENRARTAAQLRRRRSIRLRRPIRRRDPLLRLMAAKAAPVPRRSCLPITSPCRSSSRSAASIASSRRPACTTT